MDAKNTIYVWLLFSILWSSCQSSGDHKAFQFDEIQEIPVSTIQGGEGNFFVSGNDRVYLTFIEHENDSLDVLKFSILENGSWSLPKIISSGTDWFVNWADFPSLATYNNQPQKMIAHWLQKSAEGTYDYDIRISLSSDGGNNWSESFILHQDGINAEHGFVSLVPENEGVRAFWLDGRNTKGHGHEDHNSEDGAMALYTAIIETDGKVLGEKVIDNKVCDCCQTDAVVTEKGAIVVFRDRSDEEIRDIGFAHLLGNDTIRKGLVYADNWQISGCPVNGPAIANIGDRTAVLWFSAANDRPILKLTITDDFGKTFSKSVRLSTNDPIGRVDLKFIDSSRLLMVYMAIEENQAYIFGQVFNTEEWVFKKAIKLQKSDQSRRTGFPRIATQEDGFLLVHTDYKNEVSKVRTYFYPYSHLGIKKKRI
jgi:hypothetical protein